ncbi:hypothetical protein ACJX0J_006493, partial [Zea mays]
EKVNDHLTTISPDITQFPLLYSFMFDVLENMLTSNLSLHNSGLYNKEGIFRMNRQSISCNYFSLGLAASCRFIHLALLQLY